MEDIKNKISIASFVTNGIYYGLIYFIRVDISAQAELTGRKAVYHFSDLVNWAMFVALFLFFILIIISKQQFIDIIIEKKKGLNISKYYFLSFLLNIITIIITIAYIIKISYA